MSSREREYEVLSDALRSVVLGTGSNGDLSPEDFAYMLANTDTYLGLIETLVAYFRGEPW